MARILQERLQSLAEDELPESQGDLRKRRSCVDIIFTVRQLVEKSLKHESKAIFTFIDLKKAQCSVSRQAMWKALEKLGVHEETIQLIVSFHQNMKAKIHLDETMVEDIEVLNGLRQGCCMTPVFFNLCTCFSCREVVG